MGGCPTCHPQYAVARSSAPARMSTRGREGLAMTSKYTLAISTTMLMTVLACEGGSVGDEGANESTGDSDGPSTSSAPSTTMSASDPSVADSSTDATVDPDTTDSDPGTTGPGGCPQNVDFGTPDVSGCAPLPNHYTPGADDTYAACVADGGEWVLVDGPPGTAARIEAYEDIVELLRGGGTPTADDFTQARMIYATDNGLESRVLRRDDPHYPPIPEADQDPGQGLDRQCSVGDNAINYPDRCVGPAQMQPLLDEAFAAGMSGEGDPNVHAARIDAGLLWFSFVSVYKEAASCVFSPADCDSHWAYYNGAVDREESIGLAADMRAIDLAIDDSIFDGMLAVRCWRDLFQADGDPAFEDLGDDGAALFFQAYEQLDNAAWYGWSRLLRDRIAQQPAVCDSEADANWAFIQVAGPVLDDEAAARDAAAAGTLAALWANDAPSIEDLEAGVAALDQAFPCPQCESCGVPMQWVY